MSPQKRIVVVGGGAAGFFAAINTKEHFPNSEVIILEATRRPLAKILVSGGGRCNVTHNLFEPRVFAKNYPRGSKEILSLFSRFQAKDMISWLKKHGVELHAEADGRMFPTTNKSETISKLFLRLQGMLKIKLSLGARVESIVQNDGQFELKIKNQESLVVDRVMIATGSSPFGHSLAKGLGHSITQLSPSLFTFKMKSPLLEGLPGTSFPSCSVKLNPEGSKHKFEQLGPVLITHWGLSGPAILKLSAFAARDLADSKYQAKLVINWLGCEKLNDVLSVLSSFKTKHPKAKLGKHQPFTLLTKRFWLSFLNFLKISEETLWTDLGNKTLQMITENLVRCEFKVEGKGVFKEEFVTAGGVNLKEINFKTMESKVSPGLYFAGEVLDVDGITGGFNFQNAWSGAWTVAQNIGS